MNLTKLFETQRKLDERIVKEKGLEGQDLLPMKILALQVELGELANEWRGFKFWSEDREPRTKCEWDYTLDDEPIYRNLVLEEFVDCLHFILSIGLDLSININGLEKYTFFLTHPARTQIFIFGKLFEEISDLANGFINDDDRLAAYYNSFQWLLE